MIDQAPGLEKWRRRCATYNVTLWCPELPGKNLRFGDQPSGPVVETVKVKI
jgi:hypothetical protein